jgi:hypothetical protein
MAREIDAGNEIGLVLARGQGRGLLVGRLFRQREDGGAAHVLFRQRVGVDREKQVGAGGARARDPLGQRHELVLGARQLDADAPARAELARELVRGRKHNVLLVCAARADAAGIDAAMAGIEHDERRGAARPVRVGKRRSPWRHAGAERQPAESQEMPPVETEDAHDPLQPIVVPPLATANS